MEHIESFPPPSNDNERGERYNLDGEAGRPMPALNGIPTFKQWFVMTWADLVALGIIGGAAFGVWMISPIPRRYFPMLSKHDQILAPNLSYPRVPQIIPIWLSALLSGLIPLICILVFQVDVRSFWDANNAILGLFTSLVCAAAFQVVLKVLIGGFRPNFLSTCVPRVPDILAGTGVGFQGIMFDRSICTGNKKAIDDALTSWPSGHSTAAFAGFAYLFLYFNGKLNPKSGHRGWPVAVIILYAPLLAATLICGTLLVDGSHNWYDALAGAVIGSMMAVTSYSMMYTSVWDRQTNHIPLATSKPLSESVPMPQGTV